MSAEDGIATLERVERELGSFARSCRATHALNASVVADLIDYWRANVGAARKRITRKRRVKK